MNRITGSFGSFLNILLWHRIGSNGVQSFFDPKQKTFYHNTVVQIL